VGRGIGAGTGKTAGRGNKGQLSRTGYSQRPGFEGGQMPLYRRIPKRGFHNPFRKEFAIVNLEQLAGFASGETITPERLQEAGLVKKVGDGIKILGEGELKAALTIQAHAFSKSAREKILQAGGKVEVLGSVT
jgi:large subunit ribosomal protein L15